MATVTPRFPKLLHGGDYNPDQWRDYPEVLEQDVALMKESGCNAMSIGIFSWAALEPEEGVYDFSWLDSVIERLYQNGVYTVLATPSGARPAWMAEKYPEVLRVNRDLKRILYSARHNHCYSSPVYREKVKQINTALAERYANNPAVILWHLSNEYGGYCYCELCQENFRAWLKKKYGTLKALNDAYWTGFWSHTYTSWSQLHSPADHGERGVHGLTLDWKRFSTEMTVDFMKREIAPLRAANPSVPVTTNLMGFYEPLNYYKFKDELDVVSFDNYPAWGEGDNAKTAAFVAMTFDLMRGIKPEVPWLLMESTPSMVNWMRVNKLKRPGVHLLSSMQAVAHGSDSVQYFQWRKSRGSSEKLHGAVVDHYGKSDNRVFQDVCGVGRKLEALGEVCGSVYEAKTAVLYDWENRWAIDDLQGLKSPDRGYIDEVAKVYRSFHRLGANVDLVDMEADFSGYRVVAAPMLYMLRAGISEKLTRFVENGGTLVLTYWTGIVNENDLCYLGGFPGEGLRALCGLRSEEIDTLYPGEKNRALFDGSDPAFKSSYEIDTFCDLVHLEGAEALAVYESDFYAGRPAVARHAVGRGEVYYVAARVEGAFYDDLAVKLAERHGLLPFDVTLPEGVFLTTRRSEEKGRTYYFLQNFNGFETEVVLPEGLCELETGASFGGKRVIEGCGTKVLFK